MKLSDLLAKLNAVAETDKDKDAVEVLHTVSPIDVYQVIHNVGHSAAHAKYDQKLEDLKRQVADAQRVNTELQGQGEELRKKNPDTAKLQEQYQSDLRKKDEEHQAELRKRDELITRERRRRAESELLRELAAVHGIDRDYAQMLAMKPDVMERVRFNDTGDTEVLQRGKEIAIVPSTGKSAIAMLADELKSGIDPKWVTSNAQGGGGVSPDNGAPAGVTGGSAMREQVRKEYEARRIARGLAPSPVAVGK